MVRKELMEGVNLTYLPARKFKTGLLSAHFLTPLEKGSAGVRALLPAVLRRGTVGSPDMGAISARLDRLYGAELDYTVRKKGECQCIGFVGSFIDDAYALGGEKLLEPVAKLMGEMILEPVTRSGRLLPDYVESERDNLADAIRSIRNDKRDWAELRLLQELCAGEAYGVSRLGDERSVERISAQKLYAEYARLIASAPMEIFYCGSAERTRVEDALLNALSALPRRGVAPIPETERHSLRGEVKVVREGMDVTQGKLGMGFACTSEDESALLLGNLLFGGSSNSKLFLNVREKLSLCYYASSLYHRQTSTGPMRRSWRSSRLSAAERWSPGSWRRRRASFAAPTPPWRIPRGGWRTSTWDRPSRGEATPRRTLPGRWRRPRRSGSSGP